MPKYFYIYLIKAIIMEKSSFLTEAAVLQGVRLPWENY